MSIEEMDEHFRPQYSFFEKDLVDYIGKLETIEEDWIKIEDLIGISHKPLGIYNKTQEVDYYDSESENLVLEIYQDDFEKFSYEKRRVKKKPKDRHLPIVITADSDDKIYPFKDVFVKCADDKLLATVTGNDSIIIIPYFSVGEGKRIVFEIDVFSDVESVLTVFYTDEKNWDKPHSRSKTAVLHRGENHIVINIDDEDAIGRLRLQISKKPGKFRISKILISEQTLPWLEDPSDLTETTQKIFSLPSYVQKHKNLSSMCNYASLYLPILQVLKPKHICEIGCDKGENTRILIDFCKNNGSRLTIVDPFEINKNLKKYIDSYDFVKHVKEKSVDFLKSENSMAQVYFIDGDHNYVTLSQELELIDQLSFGVSSPVCVFIHDLSWPCAYRDLYYSPKDLGIPESCYSTEKGPSLYTTELASDGLPALSRLAFRLTEGGEANGVLKAVEDFREMKTKWKFIWIPSLYGLGIMWTGEALSEDQERVFDEVTEHFGFFREFLSILEWNRLVLYLQVIKSARKWKQDREYIKELEYKIAPLSSLKRRFEGILRVLKLKD